MMMFITQYQCLLVVVVAAAVFFVVVVVVAVVVDVVVVVVVAAAAVFGVAVVDVALDAAVESFLLLFVVSAGRSSDSPVALESHCTDRIQFLR